MNYLVFVMEFCAAGDLFTHLKMVRTISEDDSRLYFI